MNKLRTLAILKDLKITNYILKFNGFHKKKRVHNCHHLKV